MAATFAQSGNRGTTGSGTTHNITSQSITSQTDGIGFLAILVFNSGDIVTAATWDSVAMTRVNTQGFNLPYDYSIYLYALPGFNSGTKSMQFTTSATTGSVWWWFTVKDADQNHPEATSKTTITDLTTATISLTTLTNDALVVAIGTPLSNSATPTAQSGTTLQQNFFNLQTTWTKPQATAGSNSSGIQGLTTNSDTAIIACSVAPVGGGGGANTTNFFFMS